MYCRKLKRSLSHYVYQALLINRKKFLERYLFIDANSKTTLFAHTESKSFDSARFLVSFVLLHSSAFLSLMTFSLRHSNIRFSNFSFARALQNTEPSLKVATISCRRNIPFLHLLMSAVPESLSVTKY